MGPFIVGATIPLNHSLGQVIVSQHLKGRVAYRFLPPTTVYRRVFLRCECRFSESATDVPLDGSPHTSGGWCKTVKLSHLRGLCGAKRCTDAQLWRCHKHTPNQLKISPYFAPTVLSFAPAVISTCTSVRDRRNAHLCIRRPFWISRSDVEDAAVGKREEQTGV